MSAVSAVVWQRTVGDTATLYFDLALLAGGDANVVINALEVR